VWLWICLVILALFLIFWFWLSQYLMYKNNFRKLLVRIILVIITTDCFLTLIGQPVQYWQNYSSCNEASIIGKTLLHLHPIAFTLGLIFWIMLATFLISRLTFLFSYVLFFALSIGHSLGVWTWIQPQFQTMFYQEISLYQEISNYLFYIFLALIFAFVLNKLRKYKK